MSVLGDNPSRVRSFSGIFGKQPRGAMPCRLYFKPSFRFLVMPVSVG